MEVREGECAFLVVNPYTRKMAAHLNADKTLVPRIVPLVTPENTFYGEGAETWVCETCAAHMDERYATRPPKES